MILKRAIKKYWLVFVSLILIGLLNAFLSVFIIKKGGGIVDALAKARNIASVKMAFKGFLIIFLLSLLVQFLLFLYLSIVKKKVLFYAEDTVFRHLIYAHPEIVLKYKKGDIVDRITSNLDGLSAFFGSDMLDMVGSIGYMLFALYFLFKIHYLFCILYIGFIVFFLIVTLFFAFFIQKIFKDYFGQSAKKHSLLIEILDGYFIIKALLAFRFILNKYRRVLKDTVQKGFKADVVMFSSLFGAVFVISIFLILWISIGSSFVYKHIITLGDFVASLLIFIKGNEEFNKFNNRFNQLKRSYAGIERTEELLKEEEEIQSTGKIAFGKDIEVKDVSISFKKNGKDYTVLSNVNLKVNKGECIGIIGQTGSGKSTLLKVISGLIQPDKGALLLDGKKIKKEDIVAYRRLIGYAPQDAFILEGTLRENILFGEEYDAKRFKEVIKKAGLAAFYEKYKDDTILKEGGLNLSGGEKQRIHLARILYRNKEIFIFDEPTSNVDRETEKIIVNTMKELKNQGKTIIISSHKPYPLKIADRVYSVEGQKIKEVDDETLKGDIHKA